VVETAAAVTARRSDQSRVAPPAREVFGIDQRNCTYSVNGVLQGSQKINSELNEQTLDVDMTEHIGFVEIFSELGIRLLLLNVDERAATREIEPIHPRRG